MTITKIILENIGPFVGLNEMDFTLDDVSRRVILIGGKNGAGKTTLFNAIKTGLYGCKAYGYETANTKYAEDIKALINKDALLEKRGIARIAISVVIEDGKNDYEYCFDRKWRLSNKTLRENMSIKRNGIELTESEKSDFQSFLLQLIPPDMFKFFFFDGEGIGDFIFNGVRNTDFKAAFLKLCGLDTMEIITENFLRLTTSQKKDNNGTIEKYLSAKDNCESTFEFMSKAKENRDKLSNSIIAIDEAIAVLDREYAQGGGITKKEYQSMLAQINREENKREGIRRWLKDSANDILPFIIMKEQLSILKNQIANEEEREVSQAMYDGLSSDNTRKTLAELYKKIGIEYYEDLAVKSINALLENLSIDKTDLILNISKQERIDLFARINNITSFDKNRINEAVETIEKSLKTVKRIRKKLEISDASGAEEYFSEKTQLLEKKNELINEKAQEDIRLNDLTDQYETEKRVLQKAKEKYENYLKSKSVSDTSAKALLAFEDLQKSLYKKYIKEVEQSFKDSFDSLINKTDLLDGIIIDDDLQVYPYKNRNFSYRYLQQELHNNGEEGFCDQFGIIALNALEKISPDMVVNGRIVIPIEVKQKLSAGERQIFIMALYKALSSLNKTSVPYIIDTPFARIDALHRERILDNFFMQLRGQIIILSTDEEITREYLNTIETAVGRTYLLTHDEMNGCTTIHNEKYFGDQL